MVEKPSRSPWVAVSIVVALILVAGLIVFFYGEQITTFVRYQGATPPGSASVVAIACVDQAQDGTCDGDTGRLENVALELTQASGQVFNGTTDSSGLYRFDEVEFGNHSLFISLPFAGRVTTDNPQIVFVPAPTGELGGGIEVNVFVPITLTGESTVSAELEFANPQRPGGLLSTAEPQDLETIYPGQSLGARITLATTQPLAERTTLTVIDDFDDQCVESVSSIIGGGRSDGQKVTWTIDTQGASQFTRILQYTMKVNTVLPEIDPLICTNRVTVVDATGQTIGTTTASFEVVDLPSDRAVLEITKSVEDVNGGAIQAGDTLRYTLGLTNIGLVDEVAGVLRDDMPLRLNSPAVELAPPGAEVQVSRAGGEFNNGFIEISDLSVPVTSRVGEQVTIVFTATVVGSAQTFDRIDNYVTLTGTAGAYAEAFNRVKVGQVPVLLEAR